MTATTRPTPEQIAEHAGVQRTNDDLGTWMLGAVGYDTHAPTLHAALEAAVRAVAGEGS